MISEIESLGSISRAIAAVTLLLAAAYGMGQLFFGDNCRKSWRLAETHLLRIAIGLNLLGLLGVAWGTAKLLAGGRSIWLLATLTLMAVMVAWRQRNGRGVVATATPSIHSRFTWLAVPAIAFALITLGPALCCPTGWDELVYHHVLPRRWLADGWPKFYPDLPYSGFPSLAEILFWLMAPIESVIAPGLLTWVCWMIGLIFVYRLLRQRLAANSAATLAVAFALSSTSLLISANCYVETILMMNFAAMLLVLGERRAWASAPSRKAALLGVLAGGAAAVKLTGVAILFIPLLWYAGEAWRRRSQRRTIMPSLAIFFVAALLVGLPFYFRPWLLTGNPFYPYYSQWFTLDSARLEMSRYHHALGTAFGMHSAAAFVLGPFMLAFDHELYDGDFGWQLIILIALAALAVASYRRTRLRPFIVWLAAVFVGLYLFWHFTAQQARFAIPAILAILLLAAMGLRRLHGTQRKLVLGVLVAAALISAPWRTAGHYVGSWLAVLGLIGRADYLNESTDLEYLPLVQAIRARTPADAKLMLLFEHRGFYLPRAYEIGTPFFQEVSFTPPEQFGDAASVMEVFARQRITHVIIANKAAGPDIAAAWLDRLEPFFVSFQQCVEQGKFNPIWQSERYVLLEVRHQH